MKFRFALFSLLILVAAVPLGAGERMTMRVSPAVSFAPANLIVRTVIESDSANRSIEIVAESPDFYRSSEMQLNGDRAPHVTQFEFRSLPGGSYDVSAVLYGAGGEERAVLRQQVKIIETGGGQ